MHDQTSQHTTEGLSVTERERLRFIQTYRRLPLEIDRAEGMHIYAKDGRRYLDFLGGIAVNAAGHSHPRILEAITTQLQRYAHVSNLFYQDVQVEFVERLCRLSGYDRAFLCNSGTEATDGALKLVRKWANKQGKTTVFGFTGSFHGRGFGALSLMDKPKYKDGMGPFLPGTGILPFNDSTALHEHVNKETTAIFIEFIQGEGGIREVSSEFVQALSALRDKYGFLIVADEIQAGCGRTGKFFSFEHFGIRPDIVTTAKVVGAGLPLGAILVTQELGSVWDYGKHGTTFGGNPIACAAGSVLLDMIEEDLMDHAAQSGLALRQALLRLQNEFPDTIIDVRGRGAMVGIELPEPAAPYVQRLLEGGIIANTTSESVIRLLPPYIFGEEDIATLIAGLRRCFAAGDESVVSG